MVISAQIAFLVAAAVHAGSQLTVTELVYPALASVGEQDWSRAHVLHSNRILPLVGVIYIYLAGATIWLLAADPGGWTWAGAMLAFLVAAVTAAGAAPLHGKLTEPDQRLITQLLTVDRWRAVLAMALLGCAIAGVAT